MTIKRILIVAPTLLIIFLLQSYFWVPTYEQQTKGNPQRLNEYITASIGDASLLNPILSADSASSQIETMVFDGLIDRDEELRFRGRLATSWEIFEEAFFYVNMSADIPGLGIADAEQVVDLVKEAKREKTDSANELKASLDNIRDISIVPPREFVETRKKEVPEENEEGIGVKIRVEAPARIKLTLSKVDQDLFENLTQLLGKNYFATFRGEQYLRTNPEVDKETLALYARELLPAFEHNPVLVFHLRPNVRFHDGHIFDAEDVKFTYEAIMNPKNLSPRISDYEPVKTVEVIDPLTVRIIYKRLYSPAIGTWAMGVLPEHLLNDQVMKEESIRHGKNT